MRCRPRGTGPIGGAKDRANNYPSCLSTTPIATRYPLSCPSSYMVSPVRSSYLHSYSINKLPACIIYPRDQANRSGLILILPVPPSPPPPLSSFLLLFLPLFSSSSSIFTLDRLTPIKNSAAIDIKYLPFLSPTDLEVGCWVAGDNGIEETQPREGTEGGES